MTASSEATLDRCSIGSPIVAGSKTEAYSKSEWKALRHRRLGEELPAPAQHDERAADVLDGDRVLGTEVGQRLEVRSLALDQQHQLVVPRQFGCCRRSLIASARRSSPVS